MYGILAVTLIPENRRIYTHWVTKPDGDPLLFINWIETDEKAKALFSAACDNGIENTAYIATDYRAE